MVTCHTKPLNFRPLYPLHRLRSYIPCKQPSFQYTIFFAFKFTLKCCCFYHVLTLFYIPRKMSYSYPFSLSPFEFAIRAAACHVVSVTGRSNRNAQVVFLSSRSVWELLLPCFHFLCFTGSFTKCLFHAVMALLIPHSSAPMRTYALRQDARHTCIRRKKYPPKDCPVLARLPLAPTKRIQ